MSTDTTPDADASNRLAFPDGADFRIEIPSVEGPQVLTDVLAEAEATGVTVNRVSQGSGAAMLSRSELQSMAQIAADSGVEVCLFQAARASWDIGVLAHMPDGAGHEVAVRGDGAMRRAIADVERAVECGIRGFLIGDLGLLTELVDRQQSGDLPASISWKISAALAVANGAMARLVTELGATTINIPADLPAEIVGELRRSTPLPLDLYLEGSDGMGGTVRIAEAVELLDVGAPMYLKFGLRNATPVYPSGVHRVESASLQAREKVRRAAIALEWMDHFGSSFVQSAPGAAGLAVPQP